MLRITIQLKRSNKFLENLQVESFVFYVYFCQYCLFLSWIIRSRTIICVADLQLSFCQGCWKWTGYLIFLLAGIVSVSGELRLAPFTLHKRYKGAMSSVWCYGNAMMLKQPKPDHITQLCGDIIKVSSSLSLALAWSFASFIPSKALG